MNMTRDYDALEQYILSNPIAPLQVTCDEYLSGTDRNRIDYIALHHLATDAQQNYVPVHIHGLQTAGRGCIKTPMTQLNTPRELGKLKSDDVAQVALVSEETEEQRYVTNIVPDAEIETTDTAYEDWLAVQGLLGLKSSPPAEVDPQILARKISLNNLHWSLEVIYKFIEVNDFSFVERKRWK